MTPGAVRCILGDMEDAEWTEQQLIAFVKHNGDPTFTARKLKRYRSEKVVQVRVEHPGFGGTVSTYVPQMGQQTLAVCRLLKQKNNYHAVRLRLWLEGYPIEVGILKESLWHLIPFSSWQIPSTAQQRQAAAHTLTRRVLNEAWAAVRSNFVRNVLQQFDREGDQRWFVNLQTQLLYGIPIDFTRTLLDEHDPALRHELEEPADILAHGLQVQQIRFIREGEDIAKAWQRLADEHLLSWTRMRTVLFATAEEELELARTRLETIEQLFETLDLMGYMRGPLRLYRKIFLVPAMQALLFTSLLVLEQSNYGSNIEMIRATIRAHVPLMKRFQDMRDALQEELPLVAKELLPLSRLSTLFTQGSQQDQDTYIEHIQEVYRQHKDDLDAFWQRHPQWIEP